MLKKIGDWTTKRMENDENNTTATSGQSVNRRSFLRTSTGSAFGVGSIAAISGTVLADSDVDESDLRKAMEEYDTPGAVHQALRTHGKELLRTLAADEILASPSTDDLPVEELTHNKEFVDADEGTSVSAAVHDGNTTAHITISTTSVDNDVLIVVQPQVGRSYAIVEGTGGNGIGTDETNNSTIYDLDRDDVTTEACMEGQVCKVCNCDVNFCGICLYEVYCCDSTCYWGNKLKNSCTITESYSNCCQPCDQC